MFNSVNLSKHHALIKIVSDFRIISCAHRVRACVRVWRAAHVHMCCPPRRAKHAASRVMLSMRATEPPSDARTAHACQSVVSASTFSILALSPSASRFISSSLACSAVVAAGLAASAAAISSGAESSIRRSAMAASPHDGSSLSSRPYKYKWAWGVGKGQC